MNATMNCDIIMRGGITSGVVYPGAVFELSRTYTFKNVGGASAGAIAAAMTAAAQHARNIGIADPDTGFERIKEMPKWFGSPESVDGAADPATAHKAPPAPASRSNMLALFQPQAATAPLFKLLMSVLDSGKKRDAGGKKTTSAVAAARYEKGAWWEAIFRVALGLAAAFPALSIPILLLGLATTAAAALGGAQIGTGGVAVIAALVAGLAGLVAAAVMAFVLLTAWAFYHGARKLPGNFYGICAGGDDRLAPRFASKSVKPLGHWLAEELDHIAGRGRALAPPLTFGDLWSRPDSRDAALRLQVMTTDLSRSRPFRLPFEESDPVFYFAPSEFRRLFPEPVVEFMVSQSYRRISDAGIGGAEIGLHADAAFGADGAKVELLPLPKAANFPVAVATRMSMSFPLLLGAIPLYTVAKDGSAAERHWFSDGGMCSNFPIHFFDSAIPRWPTFGINLRYYDGAKGAPGRGAPPPGGVYLPVDAEDHKYEFRQEISAGFSSIASFVAAIKSAMQNWLDFGQMEYPGFRDRVAQVYLSSKEGGMNLAMPPAVIGDLSQRGAIAAAELYKHFGPSPPRIEYTWKNHQSARLLTFMRLAEKAFKGFELSYRSAGYATELDLDPATRAWAERICLFAKELREAAAPGDTNFPNSPQPHAILRIMPDV